MATIEEGILGGFSGKIGTVVGFHRYGKHFMRSRPNRKKKFTGNELANQGKFKLVQEYLAPISDLVKVGFKDYFTPTGGYRGALSYTLKMAVVSDDAGVYVDPALFKISGGDLPPAADALVSLENGDKLNFSWNTSIPQGAKPSDQMILLVYDPVKGKAITKIFDGTFRIAGTYSLTLPEIFRGREVDVHMGFIGADRMSQSISQYLGKIGIPQ